MGWFVGWLLNRPYFISIIKFYNTTPAQYDRYNSLPEIRVYLQDWSGI